MSTFLADIQVTPYQVTLPSQIKPLFNKSTDYGYTFIGNIIDLLLLGAVLLAFGFILFGAFQWIVSQGDSKNIEGARNTILYAAIGLGVAALSVLLVNILAYFFNVPLLACFINCT